MDTKSANKKMFEALCIKMDDRGKNKKSLAHGEKEELKVQHMCLVDYKERL